MAPRRLDEPRPLQPGGSCRWCATGRAAAAAGVLAALRLLVASGPQGIGFCVGACGRSAPSGRPSSALRRVARVGVTVDAEDVDQAGPPEDEHLAKLEQLAREGASVDAEDLLYDMIDAGLKPTAAHYNTVIDSCAPRADTEKAERWLFRMQALEVQPTIGTYNAMIRVAGAAKSGELAEAWFQQANQVGLVADVETYQALLDARRQAGDVAKIEVWFERMMLADVNPDIQCCNSVIGTFADAGKMKKVEEWLAIAEQRLGLQLNAESYNLAIAGHIAAQDARRAEQLVREMAEKGVQPTAESYTLLIGDGASYRELSVVRHWSQTLLEAEVDLPAKTYTAVIGAFAAAGDVKGAEEWFSRMVEEGKEDAEALALFVDTLVLSMGTKGMETAQEWVRRFRENGLELTPAVYAAMASADVLRGDFEQVEARLQQMDADGLEMDERSLTALLLAYANAEPQQSQLAEQMFKQQMLRGRLEATRDVLMALRAAVGGARCLALRRELKLVTAPEKPYTPPGRGLRLSEAALRMAGLHLPENEAPVLTWE